MGFFVSFLKKKEIQCIVKERNDKTRFINVLKNPGKKSEVYWLQVKKEYYSFERKDPHKGP